MSCNVDCKVHFQLRVTPDASLGEAQHCRVHFAIILTVDCQSSNSTCWCMATPSCNIQTAAVITATCILYPCYALKVKVVLTDHPAMVLSLSSTLLHVVAGQLMFDQAWVTQDASLSLVSRAAAVAAKISQHEAPQLPALTHSTPAPAQWAAITTAASKTLAALVWFQRNSHAIKSAGEPSAVTAPRSETVQETMITVKVAVQTTRIIQTM